MRIDWARRYGLMRHHFAAEMVLQLIYDCEPGIFKVGAHISPAKARIDFQRATSISELFPTIQPQADALIAADKPIVTAFSDEANHRRYWEVEDSPAWLWRHASAQDRGDRRDCAEAEESGERGGAGGDHIAGRLNPASKLAANERKIQNEYGQAIEPSVKITDGF